MGTGSPGYGMRVIQAPEEPPAEGIENLALLVMKTAEIEAYQLVAEVWEVYSENINVEAGQP